MSQSAVGADAAKSTQLSWRTFRRSPTMAIAVCLVGFVLLAAAVWLDDQPFFTWDLAVTRAVQSKPWPGVEQLMRGISWAGDDLVASTGLVLVACLMLVAVHARRAAVMLMVAVIASQAVKIAVKHLIDRPRPDRELVKVLTEAKEMQSFPSGHTVHYLVFFGFLWFLAFTLVQRQAMRWLALVCLGGLVVLVGPARVYLGAHWTSDVLGGYLLGGALLVGNIGFYRRWSSMPPSPWGRH
jgi:undecaprenyl-diphosphatase